jgi:hypothetical protein
MTNPKSKIPLNELGVDRVFQLTLEQIAREQEWTYHYFPLGGADRDLADGLMSVGFRYALVEFKFTEEQLKKEGTKELRESLCVALACGEAVHPLHNAAHFASWFDPTTGECMVNVYQNQICNLQVFRKSKYLKSPTPTDSTRITAEQFAKQLFDDEVAALELAQFQEYVDWMRTVQQSEGGSVTGTFTILAFDPTIKRSILISGDHFHALDHFLRKLAATLSHRQAGAPSPAVDPPAEEPPGSGGPKF